MPSSPLTRAEWSLTRLLVGSDRGLMLWPPEHIGDLILNGPIVLPPNANCQNRLSIEIIIVYICGKLFIFVAKKIIVIK